MVKEIIFLGPEGSYSHRVAVEIEKKLNNYRLLPKENFLSIHKYIMENKEAIAVLPFENSITSNVYENVEFVFDNAPDIIDDFYLSIKLNLIGKKECEFCDESIIYSHPKALKQCSNFIENTKSKVLAVASTSKAQEIILEQNSSCFAIAGEVISNNLEIKLENIGNFSNNKTRFIIATMGKIENIDLEKDDKNRNKKISFLCKLHHSVGSLKLLLKVLEDEGINMTKIESKPIPNSDFEYSFLVEGIKENMEKDRMQILLNNNTLENKILGVY